MDATDLAFQVDEGLFCGSSELLKAKVESHLQHGSAPIGVGIDIVEIAEFTRLPYDANRRFYQRCFTTREIDYCLSRAFPAQHFAARYAAKEAAVKALTGLCTLGYEQIEVLRDGNAAPRLLFWEEGIDQALAALNGYTALLSLTHSVRRAGAIVVIIPRSGNHAG